MTRLLHAAAAIRATRRGYYALAAYGISPPEPSEVAERLTVGIGPTAPTVVGHMAPDGAGKDHAMTIDFEKLHRALALAAEAVGSEARTVTVNIHGATQAAVDGARAYGASVATLNGPRSTNDCAVFRVAPADPGCREIVIFGPHTPKLVEAKPAPEVVSWLT